MSSANVVVISGHLGRDPEVRRPRGDMVFMDFSVAIKSRRRSGDEYVDHTDWVDCSAFGKYAESLERVLTRGKFVIVTGKLRQDKWEKDGQAMTKLKVIVDNVALGPRTDGGSAPRASVDQGAYVSASSESDDDIPF